MARLGKSSNYKNKLENIVDRPGSIQPSLLLSCPAQTTSRPQQIISLVNNVYQINDIYVHFDSIYVWTAQACGQTYIYNAFNIIYYLFG